MHSPIFFFLTYDIVVWSSAFENLLNPVRIAREKVLRAMTSSDSTACSSPLFHDLKVLKVQLKCFFIIADVERSAKISTTLLISLRVPELQRFKEK